MRRIKRGVQAGVLVIGLGACGPRVSVGDLGTSGGSAQAGSGQGGRTITGGSGSKIDGEGGSAGKESGVGGEGKSTGGSGGAAGAGSLPAGCPSDLTQRVVAPVPDCPALAPSGDHAPCDIEENGICVWQTGVQGKGSPGYEVFGCYATTTGKQWFGTSQGTLGEVGENPQNCPHVAPEAGSSCAGHAAEYCYFPSAFCSCADDDAEWSCRANAKPNMPPVEVVRLCPPAGLDESKQIKDLSEQEKLAWCSWYGDPSGRPRPPVTDNDPPGQALSYGTAFNAVGASACIMDLPIEYCVMNLGLRPDCTATLAELDDCVETIRATGIGSPGPGWVGHGCGPLLANPTCANVIAQPWDPQSFSTMCAVPLN